jgi:hypothetical protein
MIHDTFKIDPQIDKVTQFGKLIANFQDDMSSENLKKISDLFGLKNSKQSLIIQQPGEVELISTIDLSKYEPEAKFNIIQIDIHLTDWEPGQFSGYGNFQYQFWHAGDVITYDWQKITRCSANASNKPKKILQLTGVITEHTNEFINRLKRFGSHQLEVTENSWF